MLTDHQKKTMRLAVQWPKRCGCGRVYDRRDQNLKGDRQSWLSLPRAHANTTDAFSTQEHRHCRCGTTLVVDVEIHDLNAEF